MTESPDWDFKLALEFSKAFESDLRSEYAEQPPITPSKQPYQAPRSLGDFSRVFEALGIDTPSVSSAKIREPTETTKSLPSSYSSSFEPAEDFDDFVNAKSKGVRWNDEVDGKDLIKVGHAGRKRGGKTNLEHDGLGPVNGVGSVAIIELIPSSIKIPIPKKIHTPVDPVLDIDPSVIRPLRLLTAVEQRSRLLRRLRKRFPDPESIFMTDPESAISNLAGITDPNGIHVFVDFSNIIIGFYNRLKAARGLHERAYVKQPPLSYHSLSMVLERGRRVARRILVGSTTKSLYSHAGPQKVPKHFSEASICGYELNILERVSKSQPATTVRRKKNGTGNGYATATSGDESGTFMELKRPVMAEQGVDEILQMKLLESLVDTARPTTIVLASGDAAEAEYSGGFLKNAERALSKGWKVEIVAWNHGLSKDYRNKEFLKRWEGKFKIIELDDFAEELLAVYS